MSIINDYWTIRTWDCCNFISHVHQDFLKASFLHCCVINPHSKPCIFMSIFNIKIQKRSKNLPVAVKKEKDSDPSWILPSVRSPFCPFKRNKILGHEAKIGKGVSKAGRVRKDAWTGYHKTQITITMTETEQGRRGGKKLPKRQNGSPDKGCWNVETIHH